LHALTQNYDEYDSRLNSLVIFDGERNIGVSVEKPFEAKKRTELTNSIYSHIAPGLGVEPGNTAVRGV